MGKEKEEHLERQERQRARELEEQRLNGFVPPIRPFEEDRS
jgi:hypothetical protein